MALAGVAGGQFDIALGGRCDLGHCPPYSESGRTAGGALFFVIEKKNINPGAVYGEVAIGSRGKLFFNETQVKDLATLARQGIAAGSKKI
jgi:hypothetical protein